jgi:hypothetical protein
VNARARDLHRQLDRQFAEAVARDGPDIPQFSVFASDLARPIRFRRRDLSVSDQLIKATGLWKRESARNGRSYMVGRLAGLRVLIFENAERKSDEDPSHWLMIGEAEQRSGKGAERSGRSREGAATSRDAT